RPWRSLRSDAISALFASSPCTRAARSESTAATRSADSAATRFRTKPFVAQADSEDTETTPTAHNVSVLETFIFHSGFGMENYPSRDAKSVPVCAVSTLISQL